MAVAIAVVAASSHAQTRRTLAVNDPESDLMGYYASIMAFTPVGLPSGHLEVGGALSLIPSLSAADRRVGFGGTKQEDTNRCPVFPRLAVARGFGRGTVEAGYTPPVRVCGVKANIASLALSYRAPVAPTLDGAVRASFVMGSLNAAITCSEDAVANQADQTCYGGAPSDDKVAPLAFQLDGILALRGWLGGRVEPYLLVGFRRERVNFDVNYTREAGNPGGLPALDDHERLRATLSRVHAAAGASWRLVGPLRVGGEAYYAPGAVFTVRGSARVVLGALP